MYAISPVFNLGDALRACECGDRFEATSHLAKSRDDEPPNTKCDNDATTIPTMDHSDTNNHDDDDDNGDDGDERSYF